MEKTTYEQFCFLRDQRRAGEEAPEHTEKRAFEIALTSTATSDNQLRLQRQRRAEIVKRVAKVGDILTHTGCAGCLFEHEFVRWDGDWMVGAPTRDTHYFEKKEGSRRAPHNLADDIAPGNVTHINRVQVHAVEFLASHRPPVLHSLPAAPSSAEIDVLAERRRQVNVEGFTAQHDDKYISGEMPAAAACLATHGLFHYREPDQPPPPWPWAPSWWKPSSQRRNLVRAAALLIAEIERIDRTDNAGTGRNAT